MAPISQGVDFANTPSKQSFGGANEIISAQMGPRHLGRITTTKLPTRVGKAGRSKMNNDFDERDGRIRELCAEMAVAVVNLVEPHVP